MMGSSSGKSVRRSRGLTVVDTAFLLVALVLLVGALIPVLSRAQEEAFVATCGARLGNIGKAMLVYAADYEGALPRAGGIGSYWWPVVWNAPTRKLAYETTDLHYDINTGREDPNQVFAYGGHCTISSSFYLLVKYAGMDPNQFVCPQDPNVTVFTLDLEDPNSGITELAQAWDFGAKPQSHCSYAYHAPWGHYALTTSDDPNKAVAADRNPYIESPGHATPKTFVDPNNPAIVFMGKAGDEACQKYGNSTVHGGEGQNVLFLDGRVSFETRAYCSLEDDNIYTITSYVNRGDPRGFMPVCNSLSGTRFPMHRHDSFLVHDPTKFVWVTATRGS